MPLLKVRNLPDPLYRALRTRALAHGRSIDAEVRAILERTIGGENALPKARNLNETEPVAIPLRLWSEMSRAAGLTNEDFDELANIREVIRREQAEMYLSSLTPTERAEMVLSSLTPTSPQKR